MISGSTVKHLAHSAFFIVFVLWMITSLASVAEQISKNDQIDPWTKYGVIGYSLLFGLRLIVILAIPQVLLNVLGLIRFNAFPEKVTLKGSSLLTPLICIRIVTRGDFPQLVIENVARNMARCTDAGMDNYLIEVVTDKKIGLPSHPRIREVVVPSEYKPKSGALYKARALQYCLENGVNILNDNDYIVHLDEETLMTNNSVRGIINFVLDGRYDFGQGLITYANDKVVNWITTLADNIRVADDMGKLRAQFNFFHKPLFSWKGSFIVSKVEAEKRVSFDNGIRGSIAEDCYFAMRAYMLGYTFCFVDGEMWEKSPFTINDYIQQRKRWVQGIMLVVHAPEITWRKKFWLSLSLYAWISMPLTVCNIILQMICPIQVPDWLQYTCLFVGAVNIYMYIFGVFKSLSIKRVGVFRFTICFIGVFFVIILAIVMENIAVLKGFFGSKKKFYIVKKDYNTLPHSV